jgi:hypothetical protein
LLAEWFTKSFVNDIARDITMGGVVTEEQAISRAQYLDLVYSQTGTLYDLLPDAPRPSTSTTSTTPAASHEADGVIGTFHAQLHSTSSTNPKPSSSNVQNALSPTPPTGKTSELTSTSICYPPQPCAKIKKYSPEMVGGNLGKGCVFVFVLLAVSVTLEHDTPLFII